MRIIKRHPLLTNAIVFSVIFLLIIPAALFHFGPGWGKAEELTVAHYWLAGEILIIGGIIALPLSPFIIIVTAIYASLSGGSEGENIIKS